MKRNTIREKFGHENVLSANLIGQGKLVVLATSREVGDSFRQYLIAQHANPGRLIETSPTGEGFEMNVDGTMSQFEQWRDDWGKQDSSKF